MVFIRESFSRGLIPWPGDPTYIMRDSVRGTSFPAAVFDTAEDKLVLYWNWPVPLPPDASEQVRVMLRSRGGEGTGGDKAGCDGFGAPPVCLACKNLAECMTVCVGAETCTEKNRKRLRGGKRLCVWGAFRTGGGQRALLSSPWPTQSMWPINLIFPDVGNAAICLGGIDKIKTTMKGEPMNSMDVPMKLDAKSVCYLFFVVALLGLFSLAYSQTQTPKKPRGTGENQRPREQDNKAGGSNKTGKLWTITTSERLRPDFRKLLDGKTVREGLNPILVSKSGTKLSLRIKNGKVTEIIATDKKGQPVSRKKRTSERLGDTVDDCNYICDQCQLDCQAAGRYAGLDCWIDCLVDYIDCLNSSDGAREPFFFIELHLS